jgi:hypothetical protein
MATSSAVGPPEICRLAVTSEGPTPEPCEESFPDFVVFGGGFVAGFFGGAAGALGLGAGVGRAADAA